jgi:hypothetical protein
MPLRQQLSLLVDSHVFEQLYTVHGHVKQVHVSLKQHTIKHTGYVQND